MSDLQNQGHEWLQRPAGDEVDRTEPVWWGVTLGSLAYAVKARKADEAVTKAQAARGGTPFPIFLAALHGEEYQPQLDELYPDRDVVHLIPLSMVEYPQDPSQMSAEQQAAFDRLIRPTEQI
jgi:hypothetical protein